MTDERDEIRRRVDIVELVQAGGVTLRPLGKNWQGLCPFHQDKKPSFSVTPSTGRYRCWSCGESGDIFTWVMKTQNLDFVEALKVLAKQAGVTLSNRPTQDPAIRQSHESAMEEANQFFRDQLKRSTVASEYCRRRGLDEETIQQWELGYAPDVGEALATHLKKRGFSLPECEALFLVSKDNQGGYYDKFRGRVMFPIRDERGTLVAFGGRIIGDGNPKYINSGDTPIYRKSRVLYGLFQSKERVSKERRAVLCEGYVDVIACHRSGVKSALASLGTSLTEDQAKLLKRWVDEVVILYDSDAAGQRAARKGIGILEAEGIRVRVALMPEGDDPDTLLRSQGPAAVARAVEQALQPLDYNLQALEKRLDPANDEFWHEAIEILAESSNEMEVLKYVDRLGGMYPGVRDVVSARTVLRRQIGQARKARKSVKHIEDEAPAAAPKPTPVAMPPLNSAEVIMFCSLSVAELRHSAWMFLTRQSQILMTRTALELAGALAKAFPNDSPKGEPIEWLHRIEPEEYCQMLSDVFSDLRGDNVSEAILADAIQTLRNHMGTQQLEQLKQERQGDQDLKAIHERLKQLKPKHAKEKRDDFEGLF